MMMKTI